MKPYRVILEKSVAFEAAIEVWADDELAARDRAAELADDGMVSWTRVNEDRNAEVFECPK